MVRKLQWIIDRFYPIGYIPPGVRLTASSGEAAGLPLTVLQGFIDAVRDGAALVPVGAVYQIDQIVINRGRCCSEVALEWLFR